MLDDPHQICTALRRYRMDKRISQQAMARALGVTQGQVSRWESGRDLPRARNIATIRTLLWGQQVSPLRALVDFVAASALPLVLFDRAHRIVAVGRPFQRPENPLLRYGWVLDPRRNPDIADLYQDYRAALAAPGDAVAIEVAVPFAIDGAPWLAIARHAMYSVEGSGARLAELRFEPAGGAPAAPRVVRIGADAPVAAPDTVPAILVH